MKIEKSSFKELNELTKECFQIRSKFKKEGIKIKNLKEKYEKIARCIIIHNELYYNYSSPIISDKEYDDLYNFFEKFENKVLLEYPSWELKNSPTKKLEGQSVKQDGFKKIKHDNPLLSLEKAYKESDIRNWYKSLIKNLGDSNVSFSIEPKFDGVSVLLHYEKGVLKKGATRGNGNIGDDITLNVKNIKSVPKKIGGEFGKLDWIQIRGEVIMSKEGLKHLNKNGYNISNTRNGASGSIKLLDSNEVGRRKLTFFGYDIHLSSNDNNFETQEQVYELLEKSGFKIYKNIFSIKKNIDNVINTCLNTKIKEKLNGEDFDFDGLVIKLNEVKLRNILGETGHHPKWAIAYKYPALQYSTKLLDVEWTVGRSGILTPIAKVKSVNIDGVVVSKASLHNPSFIKTLGLKINDSVWIQRSGEVIPYISGIIENLRDGNEKDIEFPKKCPFCGTELLVKEKKGDQSFYCNNDDCIQKIKASLREFCGKTRMDIEGIGGSFIDLLVDEGFLKTRSDIFKIGKDENRKYLTNFHGVGDKKINEIKKSLIKMKLKEIKFFISSLGIINVGRNVGKLFQKKIKEMYFQDYLSVHEFIGFLSNPSFWSNIEGIGEVIKNNILEYINNDINKQELINFSNEGYMFYLGENKSLSSKKGVFDNSDFGLGGVGFSITGTFPIGRKEIIKVLEEKGMEFHSGPNKKCKYMLVGENAGSKKSKAEKLGLKILDTFEKIEKEFGIKL